MLIQIEYGYSDAETVEQIKENPYLQFFCRLPGYHYCRSFDASTMDRVRKRITAKHIADINERIIRNAEKIQAEAEKSSKETADTDEDNDHLDDEKHDDNDGDGGGSISNDNESTTISTSSSDNSGTLIIDATYAPSRIKYPTDIDWLNTSRKKLEAIIDDLHSSEKGKKPRTYRKQARKNYLLIDILLHLPFTISKSTCMITRCIL